MGSHTSDGTTGPSGEIEATIPVGELNGTLKVGESGKEEEYELLLGHLDPVNELSGVKGRLNNLGFDCGQPDSQETPTTRHAVQVFQASREVEPTGDPDQTTLDSLLEAHEN